MNGFRKYAVVVFIGAQVECTDGFLAAVADLALSEACREGFVPTGDPRSEVGQMEHRGLEFDDGMRGMKPVLGEVDIEQPVPMSPPSGGPV